MTPSLGYQQSTTIRKSDLARLQLAEAISLFVVERFLPAITLAGAAEEIGGIAGADDTGVAGFGVEGVAGVG